MSDRYICCDERRKADLVAPGSPAGITGIDYIEVAAGATTADPTEIDIILVKPPPASAPPLTPANIALSGGIRFPPPRVDTLVPLPAAGPPGYRLTIPGNQPTDFSAYRLAIVAGPNNPAPPPFLDPRLAAVDFSFKIGCPSDFDCAPCDEGGEAPGPDPTFDYRVRDYQRFRRFMLDRLTGLVPGFREDDPVDFTTTLVEAAAYLADQKSYRLDWIGTEAFLQTARSRGSIARHARLLDYDIGEGASARVFAQFDYVAGALPDGIVLAAGTPLLPRIQGQGAVIPAAEYRRLLTAAPIVFETVAPLALWAWRDHIALHTWSDDQCLLPRGARAATLVDNSTAASALAPGDFLLFVETLSPETALAADARPDRRHVVRLTGVVAGVSDVLAPGLDLVTVEWGAEDALPFDLVIQAPAPGSIAGAPAQVCAEARGNVMLADHGASWPPATALGLPPSDVAALTPRLDPPVPAQGEAWRPVLDRADVARVKAVDLAARPIRSARSLASVDPQAAQPALVLDDDFGPWTAQRDLLKSGRYDRDFVIETGIDRRPSIRFGDGVNGLAPAPQTVLIARGRFGAGVAGNIGPDALGHVVLPLAQEAAGIRVANPLPGRGGTAPETASAIRIAAPQAFRRQERAVTEADYAAAAMTHPEVAFAIAIARFTGAWQTILVYVDRREGRPADPDFLRRLAIHLEYFRLMGFDVALRGAKPAPLDIELLVCARPGAIRSTVAARVRQALRPAGGPGGGSGFFHADNFSFGTALYASKLVAAVMAVEGVQSARLLRFQRLGRVAQGELAQGLIRPNELEILQLADDPSLPENGRLALVMGGGR